MSIYGPSSKGSGGIYAAPKASPRRKSGGSHGILGGVGGFVSHLAGDIRDAAVGLPAGLVMMATHPVKSLEEMGKTTWHDWSPLFHGEVGKWARQVYAHPLAPILDVASVATLGAGSAAKVGGGLSRVGAISKESKLAKLGRPQDIPHEGPQGTFFTHRSANPATRQRERAASAIGAQMAEHMPRWFGRKMDDAGQVQKGRIADMSPQGIYERLEAKDRAKRGLAADHVKASMQLQMAKILDGGRMQHVDPSGFHRIAENGLRDGLEQFARNVDEAHITTVGRGKNTRYVAPPGMRFINAKRSTGQKIESVKDVDDAIKSFAPRNTRSRVKSLDNVMRGEDGKLLMVPDHEVNLLVHETASSSKLMRMIYDKPTRVWKWSILATRPAFVVNNVVGNLAMTMASLGPGAFARGLIDTTRNMHGPQAANKLARDMDRLAAKAAGRSGDSTSKWYMMVHQEGFGYEAKSILSQAEKLKKKGAPKSAVKALSIAEQGLFPITHKIAERGLRRISTERFLRQSPEVQELLKSGKSFDEAVDIASRDAGFRSRIEHQVEDILGQYHYLSPAEQTIRKAIPFYTWDRAISRHVYHLGLDRPTRAVVMAQVGYQGVDTTEKFLGEVPKFMKGVVPGEVLGKIPVVGGEGKVLSTQGLNPYSTFPDVVDSVRGLAQGDVSSREVVSPHLNPYVAGAIETITGQSLLSGAKLQEGRGGLAAKTLASVVTKHPYYKLEETLRHGEDKPKPHATTGKVTPFLYRKDAKTQIAALLGVPVKELNKQRALELGRKERGETKGRKRKQSGIYG